MDIALSSDGERFVAILERRPEGGATEPISYFVMTREGRSGPFEAVDYPLAGAESASYAVLGEKGYYVIAIGADGEKRHGPYEEFRPYNWSPRGLLEFTAKDSSGWHVVTVEKDFGPYTEEPREAMDEDRAKDAAAFVIEEAGGLFVLQGDRAYGPFDTVDSYPRSPKDKGDAAFVASWMGETGLYRGGERLFTVEGAASCLISDDGREIALAELVDPERLARMRLSLFIAGQDSPSIFGLFDSIEGALFYGRGDDRHFAYAYTDVTGTYVVSSEDKLGPFSSIGSLAAGSGGESLLFEATIDGKTFVISGSRRFGPYTAISSIGMAKGLDFPRAIALDAEGSTRIVALGREYGPYELAGDIAPRGGKDGFGFGAKVGESWRSVTDTEPGPSLGSGGFIRKVLSDSGYFAWERLERGGDFATAFIEYRGPNGLSESLGPWPADRWTILLDLVPSGIVGLLLPNNGEASPFLRFPGEEPIPGLIVRDGLGPGYAMAYVKEGNFIVRKE